MERACLWTKNGECAREDAVEDYMGKYYKGDDVQPQEVLEKIKKFPGKFSRGQRENASAIMGSSCPNCPYNPNNFKKRLY